MKRKNCNEDYHKRDLTKINVHTNIITHMNLAWKQNIEPPNWIRTVQDLFTITEEFVHN